MHLFHFGYAKNFVAGEGLVYNTGEYVEGYTIFMDFVHDNPFGISMGYCIVFSVFIDILLPLWLCWDALFLY